MSENKYEAKRKCFKCGKSPAANNVKLFRFPKPGVRNILRCTFWAKYVIPVEEKFTSIAFHKKLYSEHRMLCEHHFPDEEFTDATKKRLRVSSIPSDADQVPMILPAYDEPQPGPSHGLAIAPETHPTPLKEIGNIEDKPILGCENPTHIKERKTIDNQCLKNEKEKCAFNKCVLHLKKVCQLKQSLKRLKNKQILKELTESNAVQKLSRKISPTFSLLLQAQLRNCNKKLTGQRWTKEDKIIALRLYKRSPTCYRLLRRLFQLPSPGTLKVLLNKVPFAVGIAQSIFHVLTDFIKSQQSSDNTYTLMFDEMSLKKHFEYNMKEDLIEGFQDHGVQGRSPIVAAYALVFMIVGIRKKIKQPIAHYFSSGFVTADRLAVLLKEVIYECIQAGIHINATVCDMDGVNRRALSILGATAEQPYITVHNKEVVTLFDTPHLLKCFRNLFMKYNIMCETNISSEEHIGKGVAKWSHITKFYEEDNRNPNFVFAPALTKDHLNPNCKQKMRVKLAAQVLSHTVAAGLYAKISVGALDAEAIVTANVIANIDKLFDALNSDCADLRRGKCYATNMTENTPHLKLFSEMKAFFKNLKFLECSRSPPSQMGWIWTLNGVEKLFKNLREALKIRSLATRRLQQDPLENLFGCIRGNCGSNTNPTTAQFVAGLKTAILSSLAHIGTTGGNCEMDNNVIINNFDKFLSISQTTSQPTEEPPSTAWAEMSAAEDSALSSSISDNIEEDNAEIQACAYVCGYILRKMRTATNCTHCREVFVATAVDATHNFVECKEYRQYKKSLQYASRNYVDCVEACATLINGFLKEKAHFRNLKKILLEILKQRINTDFMNVCMMHKEQNRKITFHCVFLICVRRFCVVKNRMFADEASASALKRKMTTILHR